jgi:hypothetical protein
MGALERRMEGLSIGRPVRRLAITTGWGLLDVLIAVAEMTGADLDIGEDEVVLHAEGAIAAAVLAELFSRRLLPSTSVRADLR